MKTPIAFVILAAFTSVQLAAQTLKWNYNIEIPAGYALAGSSDRMQITGEMGVESINDGFGGSLWVVRLGETGGSGRLDRVVWLSATGVPQFTNDFLLSERTYAAVPVRLVRVTRTDALLQNTTGKSGEYDVNFLIRLKKGRGGVVRTDIPFDSRESVGQSVTLNGQSDNKGFFTRKVDGGNVVVRRFSN